MKTIHWFILLSLWGCDNGGGTDAGNPGTHGLYSTGISATPFGGLTLGSGVSIDSARIVLGRIKFRPEGSCSEGQSTSDFELRGPYVVDLLDVQKLGDFNLDENRFCRVELKMEELNNGNRPIDVSPTDPIMGTSFYMTGERGDGVDFVVAIEQEEDFKLESAGTFRVDAGNIFIAFRLDDWLAGLDLDDAEVSGGVILIDEDNNEDLYSQILENIQLSARLIRDSDDDENLDEDESEDFDAVGED